MNSQLKKYYDSLYAAAFNVYDLKDAARFITERTFRMGQPFTFDNFPFQEQALSDTTTTINFMKPAQVGCSEMMARYSIALCKIIPCFTAIYVAPFSGDASNFMNTRIDPVIEGSPELKASIGKIDNTEIKEIDSSWIYARGASGTTQALSIPADLLVFDELDKSDPDIVGQYSSRLRNSKWKLVRKLSTPTLKDRGIELATQTSHRWHWVCKCNHCNHVFIPDYETQVRIPGFDGEKKEITKQLLTVIKWQQAQLYCPKCDKIPNLFKENRFWLCENPSDNYHEERSYIINPFDAPGVHNAASLTKELTTYNSYGEAQNQVLGKVSTDAQDQLTEEDIRQCRHLTTLESANVHCMGCDMGLVCTISVGRMTQEGIFLIVTRVKVLMQEFEAKRRELAAKYQCVITVIDVEPYTDLVYNAQKFDKNVYGGLYHGQPGGPAYQIKKVEENVVEGKLPVSLAKIHRTNAFDELAKTYKEGRLRWAAQSEFEDAEYIAHCLDMKRIQVFDKNNELTYRWDKSKKGVDHWHHSTLYLFVACKLMPTVNREVAFTGISLFRTFKVNHK